MVLSFSQQMKTLYVSGFEVYVFKQIVAGIDYQKTYVGIIIDSIKSIYFVNNLVNQISH